MNRLILILVLFSFSVHAEHEVEQARPLTRRPADTTLKGTLRLRHLPDGRREPVLEVLYQDGSLLEYQIEALTESCSNQMEKVEEGEVIQLSGSYHKEACANLRNLFSCREVKTLGPSALPEIVKTANLKTYERVRPEDLAKEPGVRNAVAFGEAWRSPYGVIIGDLVRDEKGAPWEATQMEAAGYCKSAGGELLSPKDAARIASDFHRTPAKNDCTAAKQAESKPIYRPAVFPGMASSGPPFLLPRFWLAASADQPSFQSRAPIFYFDGTQKEWNRLSSHPFRCAYRNPPSALPVPYKRASGEELLDLVNGSWVNNTTNSTYQSRGHSKPSAMHRGDWWTLRSAGVEARFNRSFDWSLQDKYPGYTPYNMGLTLTYPPDGFYVGGSHDVINGLVLLKGGKLFSEEEGKLQEIGSAENGNITLAHRNYKAELSLNEDAFDFHVTRTHDPKNQWVKDYRGSFEHEGALKSADEVRKHWTKAKEDHSRLASERRQILEKEKEDHARLVSERRQIWKLTKDWLKETNQFDKPLPKAGTWFELQETVRLGTLGNVPQGVVGIPDQPGFVCKATLHNFDPSATRYAIEKSQSDRPLYLDKGSKWRVLKTPWENEDLGKLFIALTDAEENILQLECQVSTHKKEAEVWMKPEPVIPSMQTIESKLLKPTSPGPFSQSEVVGGKRILGLKAAGDYVLRAGSELYYLCEGPISDRWPKLSCPIHQVDPLDSRVIHSRPINSKAFQHDLMFYEARKILEKEPGLLQDLHQLGSPLPNEQLKAAKSLAARPQGELSLAETRIETVVDSLSKTVEPMALEYRRELLRAFYKIKGLEGKFYQFLKYHPDPKVRLAAVQVMEENDTISRYLHRGALGITKKLATEDKDPEVRAAAITAISKAIAPLDVVRFELETIVAAQKDPDPIVQSAATEAKKAMGERMMRSFRKKETKEAARIIVDFGLESHLTPAEAQRVHALLAPKKPPQSKSPPTPDSSVISYREPRTEIKPAPAARPLPLGYSQVDSEFPNIVKGVGALHYQDLNGNPQPIYLAGGRYYYGRPDYFHSRVNSEMQAYFRKIGKTPQTVK
jgi:hypothetical protein